MSGDKGVSPKGLERNHTLRLPVILLQWRELCYDNDTLVYRILPSKGAAPLGAYKIGLKEEYSGKEFTWVLKWSRVDPNPWAGLLSLPHPTSQKDFWGALFSSLGWEGQRIWFWGPPPCQRKRNPFVNKLLEDVMHDVISVNRLWEVPEVREGVAFNSLWQVIW